MRPKKQLSGKRMVERESRAAAKLRRMIAAAIDADSPDNIFLTPGTLVFLHVLLANLNIAKVALTSQEYYGKEHFPAFNVKLFSPNRFVRDVKRFRPQAVIVSVVTWRGQVLPAAELFQELRNEFGRTPPLLIADYAHAGAIGFPSPQSIGADIVCGDFNKWIAPPGWYKNLGFVWLRTPSMTSRVRRALSPFFLAANQPQDHRYARWVDPQTVTEMCECFESHGIKRSLLLDRHKANIKLAAQLAERLGLEEVPQSSILWIKNDQRRDAYLAKLKMRGLLWSTPEGNLRAMCRAESL